MSRINRFLKRASSVVVVTAVGAVLVLAGIALSLPGIPGPGLLLVIAGLAVLAKEYDWARRLMDRAKSYAGRLKRRALGREEHRVTGPAGPPSPPAEGEDAKRRKRHEPAA